VQPKWDEAALLAEYEPSFKLEDQASEADKDSRRRLLMTESKVRNHVLAELTHVKAYFGLTRIPASVSHSLGYAARFVSRLYVSTLATLLPCGVVGMLHPDTHFTGRKEGKIRREAYARLRVHAQFMNSGHRFFAKPVGESTQIGLHIYGPKAEIDFDHLSWLFSVDSLSRSFFDDGRRNFQG